MAGEDIYREAASEPEPEPPAPPPPSAEKGETIFKREGKGLSDEERVPVKKEAAPEEAVPAEEKELPPYFKKREITRWLRTDPDAYKIGQGMSREKRVQIPDKLGRLLKGYDSSSGADYNINKREAKKITKILDLQNRYGKTKDEKGRWKTLSPSERKEARQTNRLWKGFLEDRKSKK